MSDNDYSRVAEQMHKQLILVSVFLEISAQGRIYTLCLTKHHGMKVYWGVEVQLHAFLTSALDGGEWSVSSPGRLNSRERVPGTHWRGGWASHYTHTDPHPFKT
jgi:hypothetical protein